MMHVGEIWGHRWQQTIQVDQNKANNGNLADITSASTWQESLSLISGKLCTNFL